MKGTNNILSREAFIRKLGKDITLYPRDLEKIQKNWDAIAALAEKLLPEIPSIGFLSVQKRLQACLYIEKRLDELLRQGNTDKSIRGEVLLLLSYSSRRFRKAFDANEELGIVLLELMKINFRQLWINVPLAMVFMFAVEYRADVYEKLYSYMLLYPQEQATGIISRSSRDGKHFRLAYDYVVDGKSFTGKWLNFEAPDRQKENEALHSYPVGKQVAVYYNQENPGIAVLERKGPDWPLYMMACFALLLSYIALTLRWGGDHSRDYKRPRH